MAELTPLWTRNPTRDADQIAAFLAEHDIDYECWELPENVAKIAAKNRLSDDEKAEVLETFRAHLDRLAEDAGYVDADLIAIRSDFEGID